MNYMIHADHHANCLSHASDFAIGTAESLGRSSISDQTSPLPVAAIHGPQRMNPTDCGDLLIFLWFHYEVVFWLFGKIPQQ